MSLDMRVPSITEMREFVDEYLKNRHPKTQFSNEVFDDETIQELYNEVNSKYRE
jgi:hypothetical protein